jgi:cytochrome c biogenesis protein CcdA
MSFGDPNNPYGYPQQPGAPQQGYGYPAAPPVSQPYGGGYVPTQMPGITRAAQILLAVIAVAHVLIAAAYGKALAEWDETMLEAGITGDAEVERYADLGKGVVVFFLGLAAVFAILGLVLVLQYAKGGNGVRVCSIVYASFAIVSGIFSLALYGLGLLIMIVSILVIVFAARRPSAEWFRRPRY